MTSQATRLYTVPLPEPLASYDRIMKDYRNFMRVNIPFTYCAYRSILPKRRDDLYGLICKVKNLMIFRFVIHVGSRLISPLFWYLAFSPMVLDVLRLIYLSFSGRTVTDQRGNTLPPPSALDCIKAGALLVTYAGVFSLVDRQVIFFEMLLHEV